MTHKEAIDFGKDRADLFGGKMEEFIKLSFEALEEQRPKGHWIRKEDEFCWWYECDQCGEKPLHNRLNDKDALSDWCPHCGADMINVPDKNDWKLSEVPTGSEPQESEAQDAGSN